MSDKKKINEYILADKAYKLDKHIITPYKLPKAHSKERIRIEHAFGVLDGQA